MNPILRCLWLLTATLNKVTIEIGKTIKKTGEKISKMLVNIEKTAKNLIVGSDKIVISSGENFEKDWVKFKAEIVKRLEEINVNRSVKRIIQNGKNEMGKEFLHGNFAKIMIPTNNTLKQKVHSMMNYMAKTELDLILENLKGENFFNLSESPIDGKVIKNLKLGKRFTPFCKFNIKKEIGIFENEISIMLDRVFGKHYTAGTKIPLFIKMRKMKRCKNFKKNYDLYKLLQSIEENCKIQRKHFIKCMEKQQYCVKNLPTEQDLNSLFQLNQNQILVAADKNVGYVCMDKEDLLMQYDEINKKQHFGESKIKEDWYLKNINDFLTTASKNIPFELKEIIKENDFIWKGKKQEIGTLRLMPKILKMKTISKSNISNLTCRGIKSSMHDPIKLVQKILDNIYSHLLFYIENEFVRLYGKLSPSVTGIDEAITRVKKSKTGEWGNSIEMEGDFGDLYSNCNKELLEKCIIKAGRIAKLQPESIDYVLKLMKVSMNHSYFKEPKGIFKTLNGFSMGDNSAARGSEIILRIHELDIFRNINHKKLENTLTRYLRFRDDVSVHVMGEIDKMLEVAKMITNGYPKCIQFNVETKLIYGKFLNIKIFNMPGENKPITTVLRKPNSKFDIIPFNSNVSLKYKKMAGLGYFRTIRTHTCSVIEEIQQKNIVKMILKEKGFPTNLIKKLENQQYEKTKGENPKKFLGITVFDNVSKRHNFVRNVFKHSILDKEKYYLPADVPGRKFEQYIFTIKKMKEKLQF